MKGILNNIKIQGVSVAVPEYTLDNNKYCTILGERRLKKQIRLTGVKQRHIALSRQKTADLCMAASRKLISHLKWQFSDIKVLVFITQNASFSTPSTAFYIQNKLGIATDSVCFDVNLGCSSVDNGVQIVGSLMKSLPEGSKGLLLVGDTAGKPIPRSYTLNPDKIADRLLFGSAGAAFAFENVTGESILFQNESDGSGYQAIIKYDANGESEMDGEKVFEFATTRVPNSMKSFMAEFKITDEDIDYYVFHQAQSLILDMIATECEIKEEKELRSVESYGNTSGTSIAVSICAHKADISCDKDLAFVLTGFGIGLSWGTVFAKIPGKNILPIVQTNEYDEDCFHDIKKTMWGQNIVLVGVDDNIDMARYIAQDLDLDTARVILTGKSIDVLNNISGGLEFSNHIAKSLDELEDILGELNSDINGIVVFDEENFRTVEDLGARGLIPDGCHLVLITANDAEIYTELPYHKIIYKLDDLEFTEIEDGGLAWTERVLSGDNLAKIKKVLALKDTVRFALSDASNHLKNVTYQLNDM